MELETQILEKDGRKRVLISTIERKENENVNLIRDNKDLIKKHAIVIETTRITNQKHLEMALDEMNVEIIRIKEQSECRIISWKKQYMVRLLMIF